MEYLGPPGGDFEGGSKEVYPATIISPANQSIFYKHASV